MKSILVFAVLAVGLCLPHAASGGPLAPTKASDLRTVKSSAGSNSCPGVLGSRAVDLQQNPNGTTSQFSIPAKSVFVVTSLDTLGFANAGLTADTSLFVTDGSGGISFVSKCGGTTGGDGNALTSCPVSVGVAVKSGSTLCAFPNNSDVIVRGFIAKDK